jgi:hypothetical protein
MLPALSLVGIDLLAAVEMRGAGLDFCADIEFYDSPHVTSNTR